MSAVAYERGAGEYQVLTGPGPAAVAVVRVDGPLTAEFVARHVRMERLWNQRLAGQVRLATLLDEQGTSLDDILVSVHANPPTWDVRLHLHGNPWIVGRCCELLSAVGLRATTCTAWDAGDALESDAWALLPQMLTLRGSRWLLDQVALVRTTVAALAECDSPATIHQVCRGLAGRSMVVDWFTRPLRVVLAGPPNAGKSALANALADRAVSLVSPTPGTTRDWIEVPVEADGFPVTWVDSAGLRASADALEAAGTQRTRELIGQADATVVVLDASELDRGASEEFVAAWTGPQPVCVVLNKCDLASPDEVCADLPEDWRSNVVAASATEHIGLDVMQAMVLASTGRTTCDLDQPAAFAVRQTRLLGQIEAAHGRKWLRSKVLDLLGRHLAFHSQAGDSLPSGGE